MVHILYRSRRADRSVRRVARAALLCSLLAGAAIALQGSSCSRLAADGNGVADAAVVSGAAWDPAGLGATFDADRRHVTFRVYSAHATRIEVCLYARATGADAAERVPLTQDPTTKVWTVRLATADLAAARLPASPPYLYGYRAWGPNWTYAADWKPGSTAGFVTDVDEAGNRFDPNKLLLDPYATEVSHDPETPAMLDAGIYNTGPRRAEDTGRVAPKGIALLPDATETGAKPTRPFRDDVIYEVNLRGLTAQDATVPERLRGTFAGAALRAKTLKALGITAIEFLPVQEFPNQANDVYNARHTTDNVDYWGYYTLNYLSPDRRYAADRSPGGPTREWRRMVKAFHDQGIKIYCDIVFNHTAEGGVGQDPALTPLLSWRGLDSPTYYELSVDPRFFYDTNGCGANVNTANPIVRNEIMDALHYWSGAMGVDGFRFDEAPVLGNEIDHAGFRFDGHDPANVLNRAAHELPARSANGGPGVELIAEPWAVGDGTYQLGHFPAGWSDWNGQFRDTIHESQNRIGRAHVTPGGLAARFAGSSDLFEHDGRSPAASVNFINCHDGFTLRDEYSYNGKNNHQPWPFGPSDGGMDDNRSWDQDNDPVRQRQAARTGLALVFLSAGVPMIAGGDEMYRTQYGNNNPYNLDTDKVWLDWRDRQEFPHFVVYAQRLIAFRRAHPALRPATFFTGTDRNGNGRKDITWLGSDGRELSGAAMDDGAHPFLAFLLDGMEARDPASGIYVAYNADPGSVAVTLPPNRRGKHWYRVADTAAAGETWGNIAAPGQETHIAAGAAYPLAGRAALLAIEK